MFGRKFQLIKKKIYCIDEDEGSVNYVNSQKTLERLSQIEKDEFE